MLEQELGSRCKLRSIESVPFGVPKIHLHIMYILVEQGAKVILVFLICYTPVNIVFTIDLVNINVWDVWNKSLAS